MTADPPRICHDWRAICDFIQQLDHLWRLNRAGVSVCPAWQDVRIEDPLHVFRATALSLDVSGHKLRSQVGDGMTGNTRGGWVLRLATRRVGKSGTPRINSLAKKLPRRGRLFVCDCETYFRLGPEHEPHLLPLPVEAPVPGLHPGWCDPELKPTCLGVADFVAFRGRFQCLHAGTCQLRSMTCKHSGNRLWPVLLNQATGL